jgi:hypothetical protein
VNRLDLAGHHCSIGRRPPFVKHKDTAVKRGALLAIHAATDQNVGTQHIHTLHFGKPRFEPWRFQAHASSHNGNESATRRKQFECFFDMPRTNERIVLTLTGRC